MKSIKILLVCLLAFTFGTTQAQQKGPKNGSNWITLDSLKEIVDWNSTFITQAVYANHYQDSTFIASSPKHKKQMTNFRNFEKSIVQGEGGDILPKMLVPTARKKHPGNNSKALSSRVRLYVDHMESVLTNNEN